MKENKTLKTKPLLIKPLKNESKEEFKERLKKLLVSKNSIAD